MSSSSEFLEKEDFVQPCIFTKDYNEARIITISDFSNRRKQKCLKKVNQTVQQNEG